MQVKKKKKESALFFKKINQKYGIEIPIKKIKPSKKHFQLEFEKETLWSTSNVEMC